MGDVTAPTTTKEVKLLIFGHFLKTFPLVLDVLFYTVIGAVFKGVIKSGSIGLIFDSFWTSKFQFWVIF